MDRGSQERGGKPRPPRIPPQSRTQIPATHPSPAIHPTILRPRRPLRAHAVALSRTHTRTRSHACPPRGTRTPIGASLAPNSLLTCRCLPPGWGKADRTGVGENRCAESKIWQKNNNNKYFQSVNLTFFSSFKFR